MRIVTPRLKYRCHYLQTSITGFSSHGLSSYDREDIALLRGTWLIVLDEVERNSKNFCRELVIFGYLKAIKIVLQLVEAFKFRLFENQSNSAS